MGRSVAPDQPANDMKPFEAANGVDWRDFSVRLRRYVARHVDPAEADDVTGDILLRLVRHRDRLANARNPLAYLFGVARNAVADTHRRRAVEKRATRQLAQISELSMDPFPEPEPAADGALAECMIPFIQRLPAHYSEALMLTEIDGLSRQVAAARLGLSLSGLKSRVQRGRKRLKHALLTCCTVEANARGDILDYSPRNPSRKTCRCGA